MAVVALFHRKGPPSKKNADFAVLDKATRKRVRILSAFLRVAEGLDRSHNGVISHARLRVVDTTHARLDVAGGDCQLEVWGVEERLKVLEKVMGREVKLKVQTKAATTTPRLTLAVDAR